MLRGDPLFGDSTLVRQVFPLPPTRKPRKKLNINLGGGFKDFFSPLFGEDSQFDYSIFQWGWNHQLDKLNRSLSPWRCWHWHSLTCFFVCRKACVIGCTPIPRSPSLGTWWWQCHAALCAFVSQQFNKVPNLHQDGSDVYFVGSDSRIFTIHDCIVQVFPHRMTLIRDIRGTSFTFNQWLVGVLCWWMKSVQKSGWDVLVP